jgi:hypothetical protein
MVLNLHQLLVSIAQYLPVSSFYFEYILAVTSYIGFKYYPSEINVVRALCTIFDWLSKTEALSGHPLRLLLQAEVSRYWSYDFHLSLC